MSLIRCLEGSDNFDQLHHWHWIHEMHADHLGWPFGCVGELGDGNRGGVACDDRLGLEHLIEGRKQRLLHIKVLDDSLNIRRLTSTAKSTSLSLKWLMS